MFRDSGGRANPSARMGTNSQLQVHRRPLRMPKGYRHRFANVGRRASGGRRPSRAAADVLDSRVCGVLTDASERPMRVASAFLRFPRGARRIRVCCCAACSAWPPSCPTSCRAARSACDPCRSYRKAGAEAFFGQHRHRGVVSAVPGRRHPHWGGGRFENAWANASDSCCSWVFEVRLVVNGSGR